MRRLLIEADPVTLKPLHGLSQSQFVPQFSNLHYRLYNGTGIFNLGFGTLTTSTSFASRTSIAARTSRTFTAPSLTASVVLWLRTAAQLGVHSSTTNLDKFTQEVRLSGQSRSLDWLIGGYYDHEKGLIAQDLVASEPETLTLIADLQHLEIASKYREIAGFADATVHVTPQFDLQFGGRYSGNKQSAVEFQVVSW